MLIIFNSKYDMKLLNINKKILEIIKPPIFTNKNLPNLIMALSFILKLKILFNVKEAMIPDP
jgi:hypothetical protein